MQMWPETRLGTAASKLTRERLGEWPGSCEHSSISQILPTGPGKWSCAAVTARLAWLGGLPGSQAEGASSLAVGWKTVSELCHRGPANMVAHNTLLAS